MFDMFTCVCFIYAVFHSMFSIKGEPNFGLLVGEDETGGTNLQRNY